MTTNIKRAIVTDRGSSYCGKNCEIVQTPAENRMGLYRLWIIVETLAGKNGFTWHFTPDQVELVDAT